MDAKSRGRLLAKAKAVLDRSPGGAQGGVILRKLDRAFHGMSLTNGTPNVSPKLVEAVVRALDPLTDVDADAVMSAVNNGLLDVGGCTVIDLRHGQPKKKGKKSARTAKTLGGSTGSSFHGQDVPWSSD